MDGQTATKFGLDGPEHRLRSNSLVQLKTDRGVGPLARYCLHQMPQRVTYETFHRNGYSSRIPVAISVSSIRIVFEPQPDSLECPMFCTGWSVSVAQRVL